MQLQDTTDPLQLQSQTIKQALLYLAGMCDGAATRDGHGFNGADSEFGHNLARAAKTWGLSPRQEFEACKMMRKYWRQLKTAGIVLPKPYLNQYSITIESDELATVTNESKGSTYQLIRDSWGDFSCECEAASNGNKCGHIQYAERKWAMPAKPKRWVDDTDANAAMLEVMGVEDESADCDLEKAKRWETADFHLRQLDQFYELEAITSNQFRQLHDGWVAYAEGEGPRPGDYSISTPAQPIAPPTTTELEILPGIMATEGQAKALVDLMSFAAGGNALHLLTGFAGTGKSLLLQAWLKQLRESGFNGPVVFTAPTNKAVEVLRAMTVTWRLNVECVTCAKLLGLRPVINRETGREEFKKNYAEDSVIQDYDIVVVDEASMVSEDLFQYIAEESNILTKILFVGDYAQLPPVGESLSKTFTEIKQQSALTEVKRYSGSIAVVADDLRQNLSRRGEPLIETDYNEDGTKGIFVLTDESWHKQLIRAFTSDKSRANPDYCRALAWRNKTVDGLNTFIRQEIRGTGADRFVAGERLLATEHYALKDMNGAPKTLFNTSAEMEVLGAFEGSRGEWLVWILEVQMLDGEGKRYTIPVLHETEISRFEKAQQKIKKEALAGAKHRWDDFYSSRKAFAWVDYAYAMTVHKSQGSTFTNAFVDMSDILANHTKAMVTLPNGEKQLIYERNQLLYVALTRASDRIFIYE
jgi:hypothetical protein